MKRSTITLKGQTTIPIEVREHLSVGPGDRVYYVLEGDGAVVMRRVPSIDEVAGCLKKFAKRKSPTVDTQRAAVRAAVARKWRERGA